ncbi:MAG: hypothetical protein VB078_01905 [Clostridiaceae bacterium]|nr:hypothetical protein [Clostridiaceae bacterium]
MRKTSLFALLSAAVFTAVVILFMSGVSTVARNNDASALEAMRQSLYKAAITCYAIEGAYPQSYEYISQHYGVQIDTTKYAVHYEIFASNIMPDITVVKLYE